MILFISGIGGVGSEHVKQLDKEILKHPSMLSFNTLGHPRKDQLRIFGLIMDTKKCKKCGGTGRIALPPTPPTSVANSIRYQTEAEFEAYLNSPIPPKRIIKCECTIRRREK